MDTEGLNWRTASYSTNGGECVEVALAADLTYVRDSKSPERGHLAVTPGTFRAFLARIKSGELDA